MAEESKKTVKTEAKQAKTENALDNSKIVPGMMIKIHQKIKELNAKGEEKERIQVYEGMVIARKHGKHESGNITVRKISDGVGVEKIFPLNLPSIVKIELVKRMQVTKSKLYYLRNFKKKLREKTASAK